MYYANDIAKVGRSLAEGVGCGFQSCLRDLAIWAQVKWIGIVFPSQVGSFENLSREHFKWQELKMEEYSFTVWYLLMYNVAMEKSEMMLHIPDSFRSQQKSGKAKCSKSNLWAANHSSFLAAKQMLRKTNFLHALCPEG